MSNKLKWVISGSQNGASVKMSCLQLHYQIIVSFLCYGPLSKKKKSITK